MVIGNQIYPPELQLNKANTSDTEGPFLDLHLSISSKTYDKRDDFDFDIVVRQRNPISDFFKKRSLFWSENFKNFVSGF